MKQFQAFIVLGTWLILLCSQAAAIEILGGSAGDGGDTQATTFHFDANNVDFQMTRPDGTSLISADVPFAYGTAMQIFAGGVDYIAESGLQVEGADLAGANWTNSAFPVSGKVAIDPVTGRFKFASSAWQGAGSIDVGDLGDASNPDIVIAADGKAIAIFTQENASGMKRAYANEYVSGSGWQGAVLVDSGSNTVASTRIAMNDNGQAVCVFRQHIGGLIYAFYANQYLPGSGWQGASRIDAATGNSAYDPQAVINSGGRIICVFRQNDGLNNRVYSNNMFRVQDGIVRLRLMPALLMLLMRRLP